MHAMYVRARTCTYTSQVLKSLRLGSNVLGFAGIKAMAEMLEGNTALEELVLIDNSIGDAVARILAKALKVNRTLRKLDLRRNVIASDGEAALEEALAAIGGGNSATVPATT